MADHQKKREQARKSAPFLLACATSRIQDVKGGEMRQFALISDSEYILTYLCLGDFLSYS
jgi:hypothetical protein